MEIRACEVLKDILWPQGVENKGLSLGWPLHQMRFNMAIIRNKISHDEHDPLRLWCVKESERMGITFDSKEEDCNDVIEILIDRMETRLYELPLNIKEYLKLKREQLAADGSSNVVNLRHRLDVAEERIQKLSDSITEIKQALRI